MNRITRTLCIVFLAAPLVPGCMTDLDLISTADPDDVVLDSPHGEDGQDSDGQYGENIDSTSQELFCGSEDWNDIVAFDDSSTYNIGAHYGKAVASFNGGSCSASLYDNRWLITANHCRKGRSQVTVEFGDFAGGLTIARNRVRDLGVHSSQMSGISDASLTRFNCTFNKTFDTSAYGNRDIDIWRCDPNNIPPLGDVYPGDIWGYLEMAPGARSEGRDVYVLSYNKASFYTSKRNLLSPGGEVEDTYDGCITGGDYDNCFEHSADTQPGSSGGAILDRTTHRLFGLVHGNWGTDGWSCPTWATNYGSYLYSSSHHPRSHINPAALPSPSQAVSTPWAGGHGGTYHALTCPSNYLAAGVVGTTYPYDTAGSSRVGNFGLVCAPYVRSDDQKFRSNDNWVVITGGSYDTQLGGGSHAFNEYIHESLDLLRDDGTVTTFADQEQSLTMCRPGYYLTGVRVRDGNYLDRVVEIECSKYNRNAWQPRTPRKAVGTGSSGSETLLRCPTTSGSSLVPDRAVYGFAIRSGWLTDGFNLFCRKY